MKLEKTGDQLRREAPKSWDDDYRNLWVRQQLAEQRAAWWVRECRAARDEIEQLKQEIAGHQFITDRLLKNQREDCYMTLDECLDELKDSLQTKDRGFTNAEDERYARAVERTLELSDKVKE